MEPAATKMAMNPTSSRARLIIFWFCAMLCLITQLHPNLWDCMDCSPPGPSVHGMDSPGKNTGVGCHALLKGIFPTQGLNPGLPHCRQILHCLSYQESLRILEWVAIPSSRGSSRPRNWTRVSCIAGRCFKLSYQVSPCVAVATY